jgi:hypothetical protein
MPHNMPHNIVFVALLIGCLAMPSFAGAGEGRGSRGAIVGAIATAALAGPSGMAIGMAIGGNASVAIADAIVLSGSGAVGIDPMPTCGTGPARARRDAGAAKSPC